MSESTEFTTPPVSFDVESQLDVQQERQGAATVASNGGDAPAADSLATNGPVPDPSAVPPLSPAITQALADVVSKWVVQLMRYLGCFPGAILTCELRA
jgi:hypothetical protein